MAASPRSPTTIYLEQRLAKAAKIEAAVTGRSLSELVSEGLARLLKEDEAVMRLVKARRKERGRAYEEFLKELRRDGLI